MRSNPTDPPQQKMAISSAAANAFGGDGRPEALVSDWSPPVNLCEGTANGAATRMVMDSLLRAGGYQTNLSRCWLGIDGADGLVFPGYAALAQLQQNPLVRLIVDTMSTESTRKWMELQSEGDTATEADLLRVGGYLKKWGVRDLFKQASELVGFQGGCLLFLDFGDVGEELKTPKVISERTIAKGSLRGLRLIEPMLVYPGIYEAANPLAPGYFAPDTWIVMGQEVHASRFLYFSANTMSTMLRPSYNFFGISLAQLGVRYVANFENARDAAIQIIDNFSLLGLKTSMQDTLTGGDGADLQNRLKILLAAKRNRGVAVLDKDKEEFFQINTPLAGLTDLVAQQLELLALIYAFPVTKLFGTSPRGLGATGEGDRENFEAKVGTWQDTLFRNNLTKLRELLDLTSSGKITPGIVEVWQPLEVLSDKESAEIGKIQAETDVLYVDSGIVSGDEVRERVANDEESPYAGLTIIAPDLPLPPDLDPNADPTNPSDYPDGLNQS